MAPLLKARNNFIWHLFPDRITTYRLQQIINIWLILMREMKCHWTQKDTTIVPQFHKTMITLVCVRLALSVILLSLCLQYELLRQAIEMTVCNESSIIEYSSLCLGDEPPEDCYPNVKSTVVMALNVSFQTANILFGVSGNLLTLLAIPYARRRHRFGFKSSSDDPTNLYILHLAFCNLLFCLIVVPLFTLHFVFRGWPLGNTICLASVVMRWGSSIINNLLLSLIAFSRLVMIKSPFIGKMFFKGKAAKIPLMSVWILGIIVVLGNVLGVSYDSLKCIGRIIIWCNILGPLQCWIWLPSWILHYAEWQGGEEENPDKIGTLFCWHRVAIPGYILQ